MCHCQLSGAHIASEAAMPPWAATVCERVGKHLGDAGGLEALLGHAERGAQPGAAGAHDDDVEMVVDEAVVAAIGACSLPPPSQPPKASLSSAKAAATPTARAKKMLSMTSATLSRSPCT